MATVQQTNALITLYLSEYKATYGSATHNSVPPNFNRYKDKWGFQGMVDDLGYERARQVVKYYFDTEHSGHPVKYLLYNYGDISVAMVEEEEDEIKRVKLRAESKTRVDEWRSANGKR